MKWGLRVTVIAFCIVVFGACLAPPTVACGDGTVICSAGTSCVDVGQPGEAEFLCATPSQFDECKDLETNAACKTVDGKIGTCISASKICIEDICGDGIVAATEQCDDSNLSSRDGCSRDCQSDETCGNGVVDGITGEECDSGVPGQSGDGCSSGCFAEARQWVDTPSARIPELSHHSMAYDSKRHKFVLFGGINSGDADSGQTWEFDGVVWSPRTFAVSPGARAGQQMVYDSKRGVMILFGGRVLGALGNDTWAYNGVEWIAINPTRAPQARTNHAMAYDVLHDRVVLFGGSSENGEIFADTWFFDGTNWTQTTTSSAPPARQMAGMAFDAARGSVVLFGGNLALGATNDTWELRDTVWSAGAAAQSPPARFFHAMSYDAITHQVLVVGGALSLTDAARDVWAYDGTTWRAKTDGPARVGHAVAFDTDKHRTVLFGGEISTDSPPGPMRFRETWTFDQAGWHDITVALDKSPNVTFSSLAVDPLLGQAVLAGGDFVQLPSNETWLFDGVVWRFGTVGPRTSNHAMAFDPRRQKIVLFGGGTTSDAETAIDDTLVFNGTSWTKVPFATSPPARMSHAMVADTARNNIVMFGGRMARSGGPVEVLSDTWVLDDTWHQIAGAGPSARYQHAMAYDSKRRKVVLFGGKNPQADLGDTWEFDGTSWTEWHGATGGPSPRFLASMAFDAKRGVIVLYGGQTFRAPNNEVWEFDGARWTQQRPLNSPQVGPSPMLAFDTKTNSVLLVNLGPTMETKHYTFASEYPTEQCIADQDADQDGLSACDDPDCFGRCYPTCSATYSICDRNGGPRCGDGTCDSTYEDYLLCPSDCQR